MDATREPTYYIDSTHPAVADFARQAAGNVPSQVEQAVRLFYAVRDECRYNPYRMSLDKQHYQASYVLGQGEGFCIQKAILMVAAARSMGIPSRLGFANVRNHLATKKLLEIMRTDLFVFHGYATLFVNNTWLKVTPTFDLPLCEKFGTLPLEFDGRSDSIFHPFDRSGRQHMEYVHDYGQFDDFPFEMMIAEMSKYYPHAIGYVDAKTDFAKVGDFRNEA